MAWRRPTSRRCSDVAVWLLRVTVRESELRDRLISQDDADVLLRAAGIVDRYGLAIEAADPPRELAQIPGQIAADV